MSTCKCIKCGSSWTARVNRPIMCPICKRKDWDGKHNSLGAVITSGTQSCTCLRCGNEWKSRVALPIACPACLSRQWNEPRQDDTARKCLKCGNEWVSRGTARPVVCPVCKRYNWDKPTPEDAALHCAKCGHEWTRRGAVSPVQCPSCKRADWGGAPAREVPCYRCGTVWITPIDATTGRYVRTPERCPSCHWLGWNVKPNPDCDWCGGSGCDRCQSEQPPPGRGVVKGPVQPCVIRREPDGSVSPCFWCGGKGCEWCGGGADSE